MRKFICRCGMLSAVAVAALSCGDKIESGSPSPFTDALAVSFDRNVIKNDGNQSVTLKAFVKGEDVSDKATFYMGPGTLDDVPVSSRTFSTTVAGEYKFWASYAGDVSNVVSVKVTDMDIPSPAVDNDENNCNFVRRVFLNQHTGANCGYCPFMTRFLRESLVDDVKNMAVLSVLRNYTSPEPGFANVKNPTNGWPYLTFDNVVSYDYNTPVERFRGDIRAAVASPAPVGISANPYYNESTKQIIVTVAVKAAVAGEYNVGLWLMQDNYYDVQTGRLDETYNTHHNNVRVAESEYMGAHCGYSLGYLIAGQTVEWIYIVDVKDTWWTASYDNVNIDDLHFAAFVTTPYITNKGVRTYKNVNVIGFGYNEPKSFEYVAD